MSSGSVVTSKVSPYFCTRGKVSDGYMPHSRNVKCLKVQKNIQNNLIYSLAEKFFVPGNYAEENTDLL